MYIVRIKLIIFINYVLLGHYKYIIDKIRLISGLLNEVLMVQYLSLPLMGLTFCIPFQTLSIIESNLSTER